LKRIGEPARRLLLDNITCFAVQEQEYADRLLHLGVPRAKLVVTGSVKYDGALKERNTPKTAMLNKLFFNGPREANAAHSSETVIWLAGSTHAPEEEIVLRVFAQLRERFPQLRLILVPRHPDRFEEVARLIHQSGLTFARRSHIAAPLPEMPAVILLDSVGELGAAWGLADVGFTGGSLDGKRGGQSMIEPAGYGVPCVIGPHVWNFKDAAKRLIEVGGTVKVSDAIDLEIELTRLITDPALRMRMGIAARELVRRQQGATARTLDVIDSFLHANLMSKAA
jgi:3-deoxy-D-manno-octulosonic-acid transferase